MWSINCEEEICHLRLRIWNEPLRFNTWTILVLKPLPGLVADDLDLLIIGGGIVGAGVARDAAIRGLRVGLAEQFDFAFGASSRSSRLLHGGIALSCAGPDRFGL